MKKITNNRLATNAVISFGRIAPFRNICPISNCEEWVNLEISYTPRNGELIELGSYRDYFKRTFNMTIEDIAQTVFDHICQIVDPFKLTVTVLLEGNPHLTEWRVSITKQ